MIPNDPEAVARELEAIAEQMDAAVGGPDAPPAIITERTVGDTEARTLADTCRGALQTFHGSSAGFVAAPAAAWAGLEAAVFRLKTLPPRLPGETAAEQTAVVHHIDYHEGVEGIEFSAGGSDGDYHQFAFELRDGAMARASWTGGRDGTLDDAIVVARRGAEFVTTLPREKLERYSVGPAGNVEDATHEALLEREDLTNRELVEKITGGEFQEFTPEPGYEIGLDPEEAAASNARIEEDRTSFNADSRRLAAGLSTAVMALARSSMRAAERKRRAAANRRPQSPGKAPTRTCSHCEATIRPGLRFCTECGKPAGDASTKGGAAAKRNCPRCGAAADSAEQFCSKCGSTLSGNLTEAGGRDQTSKQASPPLDRRMHLKPEDLPKPPAERCRSCGAELTPGKAFCTGCGVPVAEPEPPQQPQTRQCPHCGSEAEPGKQFCGDCGGSLNDRPAPPPPGPEDALSASSSLRIEQPSSCGQCGAELRPDKKFCIKCGAVVPVGSAPQTRVVEDRVFGPPTAPPPPPDPDRGRRALQQEAAAAGGAEADQGARAGDQTAQEPTQAPPPLPAQQPPWEFQRQTTNAAQQVVSSLGAKGMIARMIRGALLDATIYRETAADPKLQSEAWGVMLIAIVLSSAGFLLLSLSPGALMSILSIGIVQAVAWLARVWIIQFIADKWLGSRATFEQLFRPLAYAQTPACLQIVPIIGQLSRIWSLITSTAAIRDVTGADTVKAAVLALAGEVGVGIAAGFAGNLLRGFF